MTYVFLSFSNSRFLTCSFDTAGVALARGAELWMDRAIVADAGRTIPVARGLLHRYSGARGASPTALLNIVELEADIVVCSEWKDG